VLDKERAQAGLKPAVRHNALYFVSY
jgi:hypothetical protein